MPVNTVRSLMDSGSYFTANNGATGVATAAAPTSYSDTAPWFTIQNTNPPGGKSIYLDWARTYCTAAGTAGVSVDIKIQLDHIVPTGGTLLVPTSPNGNDNSASGAAIRLQPTGIAATANMRLIVGNFRAMPTSTAVFVANSEIFFKFAGTDGYQTAQIGTAAAGIIRVTNQLPPVVVPPTWCLQVPFLLVSQSAASSWAWEFGWIEA